MERKRALRYIHPCIHYVGFTVKVEAWTQLMMLSSLPKESHLNTLSMLL